MKHRWQLNADGNMDHWVVDSDIHNGPGCTRCDLAFCMHCSPHLLNSECPGDRYQQMGQLALFSEDVA